MAGALVTGLAGAFGGGAIGSLIASLLVNLVISYLFGSDDAPDEPERPSDQGVKQRIPTDPRNKLPVVYGERRVSGQITYADISSDNQRMAFIISLAEGPADDITGVRWEDRDLTFNGDLNTDLRNVTRARSIDHPETEDDDFLNSGRFKVQVFPAGGRCGPMESFSSKWNSNAVNRTMPNVAYVYVELTYDQEKRVTALTNRLQFSVRGKLVRTFNPSGTLLTAKTYSNNPAECLVDYLLDTRYGGSVPEASIDLPSFFSHKEFCEDNVEHRQNDENGGDLVNSKRYTTNGALNTNQDIDQNLTDLTAGNSGFITWNYGQFGIVSDRVKPSTEYVGGYLSFSEDNIFGQIQISKLGFENKLNEVTVKYDGVMSDEQEEQVIREIPIGSVLRNKNEPYLERTLTLPFTNNNIEAERVASIFLNKSRQDITVNFTTSLEASGLEAGDIIIVSHDTPGFDNKEFLVHSVEEKVSENLIGLEITAQEYADAVYISGEILEYDPAENTTLPNPFATPSITDLTVVEDVTIAEPNIVITWLDGANSTLINQYEINYAPITVHYSFNWCWCNCSSCGFYSRIP